jgi:RNA polymerase sigma-70 factor (ECF subfamily)
LPIFQEYNRSQEPDEKLLDDYRLSGDLEILGLLYKRHMHLVYGVCLRYFEDREKARDCVMEIFEKLITEIPGHQIQKFKSWLYVLTKNFCLMEIRSGKTRARRMEQWMSDQEYSVEFSHDLHPIDREEAMQDAALRECIERLKDTQKQCIQMFYFENRSYREISEFLALDEKKVKSYLQNGKRNLKICLEEKNVKG